MCQSHLVDSAAVMSKMAIVISNRITDQDNKNFINQEWEGQDSGSGEKEGMHVFKILFTIIGNP